MDSSRPLADLVPFLTLYSPALGHDLSYYPDAPQIPGTIGLHSLQAADESDLYVYEVDNQQLLASWQNQGDQDQGIVAHLGVTSHRPSGAPTTQAPAPILHQHRRQLALQRSWRPVGCRSPSRLCLRAVPRRSALHLLQSAPRRNLSDLVSEPGPAAGRSAWPRLAAGPSRAPVDQPQTGAPETRMKPSVPTTGTWVSCPGGGE